MSKQNLLLVDGDTRSLRVLEVSLRKAGFSVTPAVSVGDALDKLEVNAPDLIISETKFTTELDGFELRRRMRASPDWAEIPFIFLTAETAIENKIKGLELGVDDYLTKPIYIKEIVTRINILLQKRQRQFLDLKKDGTRFAGRVADMPVVDVIQTIEVSRKSGVIQFAGGPNRQAAIYFRDGKVIDAEAGTLQGEDAVYRLLTWNDGDFEVEFRTVRRREAITTSSQGLLMEGMRRLDEWSRLLEQLPPLNHRFEIDAAELSVRLGEIPDENNRILRLFDGKRTLLEVIDGSDFGDLECLQAISRLYFEGMLIDLDPHERSKRDTGKPMPLVALDSGGSGPIAVRTQTPIEQVASGQIDLTNLAARASAQEIPVPLPMGQSGPVIAAIEAQPSAPIPMSQTTRAHRDSGEIVSDQEVLSEEEAHSDIQGPLGGDYRQSSLRLIDEAVAAAMVIEPSLFTDEELVNAGVKPRPAEAPVRPTPPPASGEVPLARVQLTTRSVDAPPNGTPATPTSGRRPPTLPPPIPTRRPSVKEIEEAPLLDADAVETSGEIKIPVVTPPSAEEIEDAPMLSTDLLTSGEFKIPSDSEIAAASAARAAAIAPPKPPAPKVESEDYSGVPTVIEAEHNDSEIADEGPTDPTRRRFAATVRRDDVESTKMIGSHGADRAEASGELKPTPPKGAESPETQRELVTIMPRRTTREIPQIDPKTLEAVTAKAEPTSEAKEPADTSKPAEAKSTPAVEAPKTPARRVSVAGGVVKAPSSPGRGVVVLLTLASVLIGATVIKYCRKPSTTQPTVATRDDAPLIVVTPIPDAEEITTFGMDAGIAVTPAGKPDASVAVVVSRPDAAVRADAAVQVVATPADAAQVAVASTADAGIDKAKEAKALFDKAHSALEDGDPQTALDLLDKSLAMKKTARTYLEKGRALQRMQKIDEALGAVDDAIKMNGEYAPAFEQKGMMLWSAQRYSDARPVLEHYLELDPTSKKADTIRGMLEENK